MRHRQKNECAETETIHVDGRIIKRATERTKTLRKCVCPKMNIERIVSDSKNRKMLTFDTKHHSEMCFFGTEKEEKEKAKGGKKNTLQRD